MRPWFRAVREPRLIDRLADSSDVLLHLLVEQAGIGLAIIDRRGGTVRVNRVLRRMAGLNHALSRGDAVIGIFHPDRQRDVWAAIGPVLNGGGPLTCFTTMLRPRPQEGALAPTVTLSAIPLQETTGQISGAILQLADISPQAQLEMQLAQAQKLQAIGQLAAGIAHDFNNLLTAILGAADESLGRRPMDAATLEDLQQIRTSADRGADLVRQLLAFSRQQALQPQILPINRTIEKLAKLLRRLLGSKVALELRFAAADHLVRVDPSQLDQVLVNLAINARHAMPQGGRLTLRTSLTVLERKLSRGQETITPGPYVLIEVQDTGCGIPQAMLPRIFDPFFTTRREQGGSGLGLSTVHGIVRQSGGIINVSSVAGQGTQFSIFLPQHIAAEPAPAPASAEAAESPAPAGRLVLVVDDEAGVRRLAARALSRRGWSVLVADSGEAALDLLRADPAGHQALCAVVSDVVMPGMDGPALVRALRQSRPDLPAILTSGYAEAAVLGGLARGEALFLAKPYTLGTMLDAVARLALRAEALTHCSAE